MCKSCRGFRLDRRGFVLKFVPLPLYSPLPPPLRSRPPTPERPHWNCRRRNPATFAYLRHVRGQVPLLIATVLYRDGHADHFDGPKDFFKYLLDMKKYASGRTREQIARMGVTGYYEGARIEAATAVYVLGSDALGPMGHELVPHADEAEAKEFLGDHKGRRILHFSDVTPELLDALDQGKFE